MRSSPRPKWSPRRSNTTWPRSSGSTSSRGRGAMSILVVGSVAYDTVETPFGRAEKVLGGSASFFSVAASFFAPVNLVAVVGDDFSEKAMAAFQGRPIDLEGLERTAGKTFHWQGKYSYDLNAR